MANFLGNFVSLMGAPVFYFQNLVTLIIQYLDLWKYFPPHTVTEL
jgi:hypothetical protein